VQRQPWPLVLCGPHHRPRLVATFAIRFPPPRKFMIAAAALTTSQVLRNISSACMEMRLRPDRPAHRHPRHPRHPPNPYRAWLATGAANREGASQIAGLPVPCPHVARMLHAIMFALFKRCPRQDSKLRSWPRASTWPPLAGRRTISGSSRGVHAHPARPLKRPDEQAKHMVRGTGIEPATSSVSGKRSPAELTAPGQRNRGGDGNRNCL
jgi:hypothetical protein